MTTKAVLLNKMEALAGGGAGRPILRLFLQEHDSDKAVYYRSCYSTELHENLVILTNNTEWADTIIKMHQGWPGFVESPAPEPGE